MDEEDEVIQEFLVEGREGLDQLDQELVALEDDPSNPERLASIFRTIHSLKGTSGFLGFVKLESISHVGENLLSNMRDGIIELNQPITDALLQLVDSSREILENIDASGEEGNGNYDDLVATLASLAETTPPMNEVAQLDAQADAASIAEHATVDTPPRPAPNLSDPPEADSELQPASPQEDKAGDPIPPSDVMHAASPMSSAEIEPPAMTQPTSPIVDAEASDSDDDEDSAQAEANAEESTPATPPTDVAPADEPETASEAEEEDEEEPVPTPRSVASSPTPIAAPAEVEIRDAANDVAPAPPMDESSSDPVAAAKAKAAEIAAAARSASMEKDAMALEIEAAIAEEAALSKAGKAPEPSAPAPSLPPRQRRDSKASTDVTIRVDVSLLDRLMNLVGELVLSRNQILQVSSRSEDSAFLATTQRLNHITTELQEGLMKTRMQPIKSVWAKFPRVVRDLAKTCDKDVRIEMEGEDTELDRTIIEAIKDPMTHIVRNSVDHGVEFPDERSRRGKPRQGRLSLRAYHEGGKVNIEISDDGKGLDVKRIREKAVEKGVCTAGELARMTEREAMQLIFAPGFSTAAAVTQVSGRGVGMDVVKTNIEKIGGTIDLSSRVNLGTTIKIKIPLTLAIIPALVVDCSGDSYAIPQVSLLELVRFEKEQATTAIEQVHGAPVCRLRGNLLPLVYLHEVLGVDPVPPEDEAVNIVVLQADDRHFGLVVDHVSDTEEIVVKPLGKELKSVDVFAGATIMGDGRVALILDVLGVAHAGQLAAQERDRRLRHVGAADRDGAKKYTMLVFKITDEERGAVPLKTIARLEEVPSERIERSGGDEVVQYRGEIMPIIRISSALGRPEMPRAKVEQVLVYQRRKRSIGVVVEAIEDVVEEQLEVHRPVNRIGVKGEAVLQGRVTELVDLPALIESVLPGFFDADAAE